MQVLPRRSTGLHWSVLNLFFLTVAIFAALQEASRSANQYSETSAVIASTFGNLALQSKLNRNIDKVLGSIKKAKRDGMLSEQDAQALSSRAIQGLIGNGLNTSEGSRENSIANQP